MFQTGFNEAVDVSQQLKLIENSRADENFIEQSYFLRVFLKENFNRLIPLQHLTKISIKIDNYHDELLKASIIFKSLKLLSKQSTTIEAYLRVAQKYL